MYALVVGKGGSKLQEVEFGRGSTSGSPGHLTATRIAMRNLTEFLSRQTGRPADPGLVWYLARTEENGREAIQRNGQFPVRAARRVRDQFRHARPAGREAAMCERPRRSRSSAIRGEVGRGLRGGAGRTGHPGLRRRHRRETRRSERICDGLGFLGIELDRARNAGNAALISLGRKSRHRTGHPHRRGAHDREVGRPPPRSRLNSGNLDHDKQHPLPGTAPQNGCLLARRELSVGRPDLSLRQSAAEAAAGARGREAHAAGALGHDARAELHLRAPEPGHQEIRPRHDLRLRPRARRPGRRRQHLSRGHLQRDLSRTSARTRPGCASCFMQFSFPGGIPSHASPECPGSIHEGGELGYSLSHSFGAVFDNPDLIVACVVGDGEAETGTAGHGVAFQQVSRSGHGRRGAADPASQRLQDRQSDHPRAHRARGTGTVAARLRLDAVFRRGTRAGTDASGDGRDARHGGGADQEHSARRPRQRRPDAPALADDRAQVAQGLDRAEGGRRPADRRHFPCAPGAAVRPGHPSRTSQAAGRLAEELPAGGTVRRAGPPEAGTGRTRAQGRTPHGRESARQRRHAAARPAHAGFSRLRGRRARAGGARHRRHARARAFPARCGEAEPRAAQFPRLRPRRDALQRPGSAVRSDQAPMGRSDRAERRMARARRARARDAERAPVRRLARRLSAHRAAWRCSTATRRSSTSSIRCSTSTPSG